MAQARATMQDHSNELVKCIEDLKRRFAKLDDEVSAEDAERSVIQNDIDTLNKRAAQLTEAIERRRALIADYDKSIAESESSYSKIVEMAGHLVSTLEIDAKHLAAKEMNPPPKPLLPTVLTERKNGREAGGGPLQGTLSLAAAKGS